MESRHPNPRRDERSWVSFLEELWGRSAAEVGIGDDCAILPPARYAISTDALVEGIDFERAWAPPEALGHKALASNLSDLAASGAAPKFLLLTLGIPPDLEDAWVEGVLRGMRGLAAAEGVGLAGGDLSASPSEFFLSLTVLGIQTAPPILRSGGRPGDLLALGGPLGGARAGLGLFLAGVTLGEWRLSARLSGPERLLRRFYAPPSQTALGTFLAERGLATCAIDLSDGLATDLARLCEASACGATLEEERIPLEEGLAEHHPSAETALECALRGGEDQVLLFAVPPHRAAELAEAPGPVHLIGSLARPESGLLLRHSDGHSTVLRERGHDHFAR